MGGIVLTDEDSCVLDDEDVRLGVEAGVFTVCPHGTGNIGIEPLPKLPCGYAHASADPGEFVHFVSGKNWDDFDALYEPSS